MARIKSRSIMIDAKALLEIALQRSDELLGFRSYALAEYIVEVAAQQGSVTTTYEDGDDDAGKPMTGWPYR